MNIYLTTPIYYASGSPHLGHAYTSFLADCYKRYLQLCGHDVLLTSGTDEHGQKIERTAAKQGIPTQAFVDAKSEEFRHLWTALDVSVDLFERTTGGHHKQVVIEFWQRLKASGDIYRGAYSGLYCVECEQYFTVGSECPVHKIPLESFSEKCWFFRLSRYQQALIDHIESHADFIVPQQRRNEVLSFLQKNKLRDLSVSRSSTKWGIPVPGDPEQVLYVWIDALVTYLSALSAQVGKAELESWRKNTVHFIGKDIIIFHAVYWPALLLSVGLPLPQSLVVNGWLTVEGEKIAKSNPATIVNPLELANEFGTDGLKYYFLRTVGAGADSDFSREQLKQVLNTDLANNLGNLVSRVTSLVTKFHGGCIIRPTEPLSSSANELLQVLLLAREKTGIAFRDFLIANAAELFVTSASRINNYLQNQQPWKETDPVTRGEILWVSCLAIKQVSVLATPFVPELAQRIRNSLGIGSLPNWSDTNEDVEEFQVNSSIKVFPRLP